VKRLLAALALLAVLAPAAGAFKPGPGARADAKRFGLDRLRPTVRYSPAAATAAAQAFAAFNAAQGGHWTMRLSPRTGLPAALIGGRDYPRSGRPDDVARSFLGAHRDVLGIDPAGLSLERQISGPGARHLLYRQSYRGIPVEAAAVKVHLDQNGSIIGVHSSYEPNLNVPTTPAVAADAAGRAAVADAGAGAVRGAPTLVILPLETDGRNHLAWKLRVDGGGGAWRYFIDALTGQVLFRYNVDRFIGSCLSSGTVNGMVYDIDPSTTPGPVRRPFNDQYVYASLPPVRVLTATDPTYGGGFFCAPVLGKVAMSLQGPNVSVSEFRQASAHYDDGAGVWSTVATPVSSPHPYADGSVQISTINLAAVAPNAVEFLPVFTSFQVGGFSGSPVEGGGITDDDQLTIYDSSDNAVASYLGARGAFNGAAVHGQLMHLALRSNASGTANGYDIAISSVLTLSNPTVDAAPLSSHTWTAADSPINLTSEISLFYHLNKMHDYFAADVNRLNIAPIVKPVVAMAHTGPNLVNAFYDPDYDDLFFGDIDNTAPSDAFTEDATVPHHEYVHYVVEKIWSIQNYGQAGAISEANADYFAASSLNYSAIGTWANGGGVPLRELDSTKGRLYSLCDSRTPGCLTPWTGEIHDDSPFVSQALWDIRKDRMLTLGLVNGQSCADNLEFQSLLFFPESFAELYEAMLQVDRLGLVPACGAPGASQGIITQAFGNHVGLLISATRGDAYEPNDGFETAVDISTLGSVSATIYPLADTDFYSFGAGPGLVQLSLKLPPSSGGLFSAYQIMLYDASRHQVALAAPPYNGFGTLDGYCNTDDCNTTQGTVVLSYNNPAGGLLYAQVVGGDTISGSNSGVNSTTPYTLSVSYPQAGALTGSIVSARFDNDAIGFTVNVSTFVGNQDLRFAFARLRDQSKTAIPNTVTHVPPLAGDYLTMTSSKNANGQITGQLALVPGFAARFPAVGTVYLEVFGYDVLASTIPAYVVHGSSTSLGLSNPLNLSAAQAELTAYNNLLTPGPGQKATVKYAVNGSGHLTLKLYTVTGRLVSTLFDADVTAGKGSVDWDGHNSAGNVVASGVYVLRADGPGLRLTKKIVVVK